MSHAARTLLAIAAAASFLPPVAAAVIHVPMDAATIQMAINAASSGDEILVGPGHYGERINYLGKRLRIASTSGAAVTTIDAGGIGTVVTIIGGEPAGTELVGFAITGGAGVPLIYGLASNHIGAGGILVMNDSNLAVRDCVIAGNVVDSPVLNAYGGGIYVTTGKVLVENSTLTANRARYGAALSTLAPGQVTLIDCTISGNVATSTVPGSSAAVISAYFGSFTATRCLVAANVGTGLKISGFPKLTDCTFVNNSDWGVNLYSEFPTLDGARFLGNGGGGAIVNSGAHFLQAIDVRRCEFANGDTLKTHLSAPGTTYVDRCTFDGSGVIEESNDLDIRNCIFRNSASPIAAAGAILVEYSNVQGGWPGTGNIDADPLWVAPASQDYALLPGSPCINSGDPSTPADADLSTTEMGARPYQPWTSTAGGVAGIAGVPALTVNGPLEAGTPFLLDVAGAPPATGAVLFAGAGQLGVPFLGGIFWPQPTLVLTGLATDGAGALALATTWPTALPAGTELWFQAWLPDPGATFGVAGTNGVRGIAP